MLTAENVILTLKVAVVAVTAEYSNWYCRSPGTFSRRSSRCTSWSGAAAK